MQNFIVNNPTKLFFGQNVCNNLPEIVTELGNCALMVYGKNSIKANGVYNIVNNLLSRSNIKVIEFSGIKSNPEVEDVKKAIEIGIANKVNFVIAVGGGSVIDSAKIMSLCIPQKLNPWDVMKYKTTPNSAIPLITVLTLAATGSEMNQFAVLQNSKTSEKIGFGSSLIYPKVSFCDPSFTFSVSKQNTSYGLADIIAHCLEAYFGSDNNLLTDRFVVSIIKEIRDFGPLLLNNLNNYELRARAMWASTCALNGLTFYGKKSGDWGVHDIGHSISFLYDTPHGATLSIVYPAWLKHFKDKISEKLLWLGKELFNTNNLNDSIQGIENLFTSIGSPTKLSQVNILNNEKKNILSLLVKNKATGMFHKLNNSDLESIINIID